MAPQLPLFLTPILTEPFKVAPGSFTRRSSSKFGDGSDSDSDAVEEEWDTDLLKVVQRMESSIAKRAMPAETQRSSFLSCSMIGFRFYTVPKVRRTHYRFRGAAAN